MNGTDWHVHCKLGGHPFNFTMKKINRITLLALFAALAATGLQAQTTGTTTGTPTGTTTGGTTSGGTTTGGTTTGGTTTGGSTTGGSTTGTTTTTPTTGGNAKGKDKEKEKGPNENASQRAKDVHEVLAQFRTLREDYLAERKALLEKLKTAKEDEKKAILDQLRADSSKRDEEERALGKQIRDELKSARKGGGE